MKFYSGNYYCSRSNWNGEIFDCRNLVSIETFEKHKYNPYGNNDSKNLLVTREIFDEDRYNFTLEYYGKEKAEDIKEFCVKKTYDLKISVRKWLNETVKDDQDGNKGWCIGDDMYNTETSEGFSMFFYRRKDALLFIKTFSEYGKPTETFSQHTYVKKKLDLDTMKLVKEVR